MSARDFTSAAAVFLAAIFCAAAAGAQHVVSVSDEGLVLSSGSDAGVRKGMTGKICSTERVGGRVVENCTARFVVTSVSSDRSSAQITKGDLDVKRGARAKFDETLTPKSTERKITPPKKRDPAEAFLRDADRAFRDGDYSGALERYKTFLKTYPDNEKADFAADRAYQCQTKLAALAAAQSPPVAASAAPPAPMPSGTPVPPGAMPQPPAAAAAPAPPPVVPAELQQADDLATMAEKLFQSGQLAEARSSALAALRADSTNPRARTTLRAVQIKSVQSRFNAPADVAATESGCYVADAGNDTIRLLTGEVSTTAAGAAGQTGFADGPAVRARFNEPTGVAIGPDGAVYIVDHYNSTIRRIGKDGSVATIAGRAGLTGNADGPRLSARFNGPRRLIVATDGTLYVADTGNHTVRKISAAGVVETMPLGSAAERADPVGLAIDREGDLLVADSWSHVIRKIDRTGRASVFAGVPGASGSVDGPVAAARFNGPEGVAVDDEGAVYVADSGNHTIRKIVNGVVTTVAGRVGLPDAVDGSGSVARLNHPSGIRCDARGRLWIADSGNHTVRLLTAGFVETVAGLPGIVGSSDGAN